MIIFHSLPHLDSCLQHLEQYDSRYGTHMVSHYTLFGHVQNGPVLKLMPKAEFIPESVRPFDTESAFDYYYWIQLETDPESFLSKTDFLRLEYLYGTSIIIAIQIEESPYRNSIVESLMGHIRSFYGLETKLILSMGDLADPHFFDYSGFSFEGLHRLSEDLVKADIMKGGNTI